MTNSLYTTSQSESLIFAQPDTSEESSFIKILNILIGPLKSGGFFCSVLRSVLGSVLGSVSRSVSRSVLGSVLGSVLKSVIDLKNGLTIIYSHALRKSKLFRKDVYHFNSF
uniref:Uncharacterized protein n=1 Tax=Lactococcus garvieae TaxID=1363 RepID=A0A0D4CBR3_9LACT|nr:Hypothetical protein [Lactococcus garvieae]